MLEVAVLTGNATHLKNMRASISASDIEIFWMDRKDFQLTTKWTVSSEAPTIPLRRQ